jgi:hypothetical protein
MPRPSNLNDSSHLINDDTSFPSLIGNSKLVFVLGLISAEIFYRFVLFDHEDFATLQSKE